MTEADYCSMCGEKRRNHVVGEGHCPFYSTEKETGNMAHGEPRPEDAHHSTFGNAIHNNNEPGLSYGDARERAPQRDTEHCLKCDHTWQQHYLYEGCGGYTAGEKCGCYYSRPQVRALGAASEVIERLRREVAVLRGFVDKMPSEQTGTMACRICFREGAHNDEAHEHDIKCVNAWREYRLGIGDFGSGLTQWADEMQRAIARRSTPSTDPAKMCKRCGEAAPLLGGICGTCGDDLRQEADAERVRAMIYQVGRQPCYALRRGPSDVVPGAQNEHQCMVCGGRVSWCENCMTDHHENGWDTCRGAQEHGKPSEATQALIAERRAPCYLAVHTDAGVHSNPACAGWRAADALAALDAENAITEADGLRRTVGYIADVLEGISEQTGPDNTVTREYRNREELGFIVDKSVLDELRTLAHVKAKRARQTDREAAKQLAWEDWTTEYYGSSGPTLEGHYIEALQSAFDAGWKTAALTSKE